jgi:hypothetical protein
MPISMDLGFRKERALVVSWTCQTNEVSDENRLEAKIAKNILKTRVCNDAWYYKSSGSPPRWLLLALI